MIKDDSILKKIPKHLNPKQQLLLDGLRHGFEFIELLYERLRNNCILFSRGCFTESNASIYRLQIFSDVWAIIDHTHRIRKLIIHFKTMQKGIAELKEFINSTKVVHDLRNCIQHLEDEVNATQKLEALGYSLYGALSWVFWEHPDEPAYIFYVMAGVYSNNKHEGQLINPLGKNMQAPLDLIQLKAFGLTTDISNLYFCLKRLAFQIENAINSAIQQSVEKAIKNTDITLTQALEPCLTDLSAWVKVNFPHHQ